MSDRYAHSPIVIDRVERSRGDGDSVMLRLTGRRLIAEAEAGLDALLVISVHGRRHRFAAGDGPGQDDAAPGGWKASFAVPDWAVPVEHGQASIWVGSSSIPVPPAGTKRRTGESAPAFESAPASEPAQGFTSEPQPAAPGAAPAPQPVAPSPGLGSAPQPAGPAVPLRGGPAAPLPPDAGIEAGRAGPLADALIRDTVSALHAELARRSERETMLEVALDRTRSELSVRASAQAELEATQVELRAELARLAEAVSEQQREFERRLDEVRERFESELAQERSTLADGARERDGLRSELADAQAESARARDELMRAKAEQEHAVSELAQVRAEHERTMSKLTEGQAERERAASALQRARSEADRVRAELGEAQEQQAEFAHVREQLADANERLTAALHSGQVRAQEASSLREQLAAAQISRDAAIAEAGGLRSELARLGSEVAVSRERSAAGSELGDAQQLLEEARALSAQLRQPSVD